MSVEESLHTQMQNLIESSQWERARDVIYEMLSNQPDSSWLHCKMGSVMYELDEFSHAESHLKKAITQDPSYAEAYSQLAWVYFGMKRAGTADDTNKVALSLDPEDFSSWLLSFQLGLFYDDLSRAKKCLEQIEYFLPESEHLTNMRTAYYSHPKNKEKLDVAAQIKAHEKSLAQNPEFDIAHYHIAELYLDHTKDYTKAEFHIKKALLQDPSDQDYQRIYTRIIRKRNPLLRILNAPLSIFESVKRKDKMEEFCIVAMIAIAIIGFTLGENNRHILKYLVLGGFGIFAFIYPITKLYQYLTLSELFHEMNKIHLFKGPMKKIHQLPYSTRFIIFATLTLVFWLLLFLSFQQILLHSK